MPNPQQLARRFREVILNGTWIANTNFKDQLQHLDWKFAVTEVHQLNTVAMLAQHIHYYINGINAVFNGKALEIRDRFSFDFAPITSQQQWDAFLDRLWEDAETFAAHVEKMPPEKLQEAFTDEKYGSYSRNIEAMIEHSYYHLGQIVMLIKISKKDQ